MFSSGFICLAVPLFIETDKLPPFHPPKEKGKKTKQYLILFFLYVMFFSPLTLSVTIVSNTRAKGVK